MPARHSHGAWFLANALYEEDVGLAVPVHSLERAPTGFRRGAVRALRQAIEARWSVKARAVLGPRMSDSKFITILGRSVCWKDDDAIEYAADPAHRLAILRAFDL